MQKLEFLYGDSEAPISVKEAVNSTRFKQICFMFLFGTFNGLYVASAYKVSNDYLEDGPLTIAGAIGAVCNGGSRLMWGTLQDKYGFKTIYRINQLI